MDSDDAYWEEVRQAVGNGTRSLLWGTSTRSLRKSLDKIRAAAEEADAPPSLGLRQPYDPNGHEVVESGWEHECG